jgi:hypothetical protein
MHSLLPLPLALLGLGATELAVLIAIAGMILGGTMGIAAIFFHYQRQRMRHETARMAIEKGRPVPEFAEHTTFQHPPAHEDRGRRDLRSGLVLLGVGAGIYLFFTTVGAAEARFLGAIPGFIGVALLLNALFTALLPPRNPRSTDHPPQS